jgi:mono/diheme cytochrome c family protein
VKYALTVLITLAVLVLAAIAYTGFGLYNIAATQPHWGITTSFIEALRDRSIAMRSDDIVLPDLDDPELRAAAFSHYHGMCRLCHGAPGYRSNEFAKGLYPVPPLMTSGDIQKSRSDAKIYWIVKHGIKLTGMPAFGPTHGESELWGLVALTKEMPAMDPGHYRQQAGKIGETGHGHTHGELEKETDERPGHDKTHEHGDAAEDHHHE